MTEADAKTKWCPFARVAVPMRMERTQQFFAAVAANRVGASDAIAIKGSTDKANPESARCLASGCMAWRWETEADFEHRVTEWEDAANIGGVQRGLEPVRIGFCGLAGQP